MRFTRRRWLAAGTLFAAFVVVVASFGLAEALRTSHAPARIDVQATPITAFDPRDESKTRFGQLEFRGGLALTSSEQAFGGISALAMEPDGAHFLSVTDQGSWLLGRIVYRDGRPAAIADAQPGRYERQDDGDPDHGALATGAGGELFDEPCERLCAPDGALQ